MPVRRDDPRTEAQKRADEAIQVALERGELPRAPKTAREAVVARARRKGWARRTAANLGLGLAAYRKALGITQSKLAKAVGTQRSDISRLESGSYGGLTIERFLLILGSLLGLAEPATKRKRASKPSPRRLATTCKPANRPSPSRPTLRA